MRWATVLTICLTGATWAVGAQTPTPSPRAELKRFLGGTALDAIGAFNYRLTVEDASGRVLRDSYYVLLPAARLLHTRDRLAADHAEIWSGAQGTWQRSGTQLDFLGPALAQPYRRHVAYHFHALLLDEATGYEALAADRVRIAPSDGEPFEILLDLRTGRIAENHFAAGTVSRELDYRTVGAVPWPMRYEIVANGQVIRRGRFSETSITPNAVLPQLDVAKAPQRLPQPQADVARLIGAGWLSTSANEYNLSVNATGDLLVFARSSPEFKSSRIWIARRQGEHWSEPVQVPFSDPRYDDSDPWLAPDGSFLYFISNRPARGEKPRGDLDIWRVPLLNGGFGTPEHLDALGSEGRELGPEVHDGWIYFNSSRQGGPAKLAIYRARLNGRSFNPPEPLGSPFNDGTQQGDFTLSPDGRLALFWSERDGSHERDLFAARREGNAWSKAVRLPAPLNAAGLDFTPSFSADGRELHFASMRKPPWLTDDDHVLNGQSNLYVAPAALVEQALP